VREKKAFRFLLQEKENKEEGRLVEERLSGPLSKEGKSTNAKPSPRGNFGEGVVLGEGGDSDAEGRIPA